MILLSRLCVGRYVRGEVEILIVRSNLRVGPLSSDVSHKLGIFNVPRPDRKKEVFQSLIEALQYLTACS